VSWKLALGVAISLVLMTAIGRVVEDPDTGTATWDAARAAGFAGYALAWLSVMGGMLLHLRLRLRGLALTWFLETHRMLSALALAFVAAHVAGLLMDPVVHFGPVHVAVPFTSEYRPWQTGLGTAAAWLMAVVLTTTALAGRMSYNRWRAWHLLAFPAWALALVHGLAAGTDSGATAAVAVYAGTAAAVAALAAVRIAGRGWVSAGEAV